METKDKIHSAEDFELTLSPFFPISLAQVSRVYSPAIFVLRQALNHD